MLVHSRWGGAARWLGENGQTKRFHNPPWAPKSGLDVLQEHAWPPFWLCLAQYILLNVVMLN